MCLQNSNDLGDLINGVPNVIGGLFGNGGKPAGKPRPGIRQGKEKETGESVPGSKGRLAVENIDRSGSGGGRSKGQRRNKKQGLNPGGILGALGGKGGKKEEGRYLHSVIRASSSNVVKRANKTQSIALGASLTGEQNAKPPSFEDIIRRLTKKHSKKKKKQGLEQGWSKGGGLDLGGILGALGGSGGDKKGKKGGGILGALGGGGGRNKASVDPERTRYTTPDLLATPAEFLSYEGTLYHIISVRFYK